MTFTQRVQLLLLLIFLLHFQYSHAERPSKANYTTTTVHNCVEFECARSLYHPNTLDLQFNDIEQSKFVEYEKIISDYINDSHIQQTNFPEFTSTINSEIPASVINNALHCHKTKPQYPVWKNAQQKTSQVIFKHQCWQLISAHNKKPTTKAISNIIYSVTITRTASKCTTNGYLPSKDSFECLAPKNIAQQNYSLLPLEDVKQTLASNNLGDIEYALFEVTEEFYAASSHSNDNNQTTPETKFPDPKDPPTDPEEPITEPAEPEQPTEPEIKLPEHDESDTDHEAEDQHDEFAHSDDEHEDDEYHINHHE